MTFNLPVHEAIPSLLKALEDQGRAVLQAPPGAGKTTVVPLELLRSNLVGSRIVMLEPRRLAARAAAERMAKTLGEKPGQTVGYRIRGESRISRKTKIEVVTEGILTRMMQSNPELPDIGCIIFDEFHERSLNADLGLALSLEIADALREDIHLLVMSATLDAAPVAELMNAPVITSEGRAHNVDIRYLDRPMRREKRFEDAISDLIEKAVSETEGGVLAFLPGVGEINRAQALLENRLPQDCRIQPLYGAMNFTSQKAAIAPAANGRKIVLATSIAETSLTIEDIRCVVDGGKARRSRFDPGSGMSRLYTCPASRAETTQRAGRAGRISNGTCYRLWTKGQELALPAQPPAEMELTDLATLALELALWGTEADKLAMLTRPNPGNMNEAKKLLKLMNALDKNGGITPHGRRIAKIPVHPRLAHMLVHAGPKAALMAALLSERDPLANENSANLSLRLEALRNFSGRYANHPIKADSSAIRRIRLEAKRLADNAGAQCKSYGDAEMAALAYPDRIGLRRKGDAPRYLLSGGKGAFMPDEDQMAGNRLIVATDLDGNPKEARIRQAIAISEAELRGLFADLISKVNLCQWNARERRVVARTEERLGALTLNARIWKDAPQNAISLAMIDGIREIGLTWTDEARRFAARVEMLRNSGHDMPEMTEEALLSSADEWLLPYLNGVLSYADWRKFDIAGALRSMLDWHGMQQLDKFAPAVFSTPLGRGIPIEYKDFQPSVSLRLQEMFGQTVHPFAAGKALRITLLSPANRPVQTTTDISGFWRNSYADVRREMRGRYPRHSWPENPEKAVPSLKTGPGK